ncbi:hypothetical protein GETHLI_26550 [Geothrix limicola]|uniref:Uncharacterized protein n=1 Tax=Geothrix limicola TaxID=2927978 RepID=A0ABQ5QHJ0_9BACT|nr:hypothetical protein [Geothrix limicola]GLH74153.1 hypothetical protein GETHLI_26550 [Geothrix limicola]
MQAVVFKRAMEIEKFEVKDRFEFEDRFLAALMPPRPCREYTEPHPSPSGIRVFRHPVNQALQARPYLEFVKHIQNETHFHVMQEGRSTGLTVVLAEAPSRD